jgi:hypothetical protein
MKSVASVQASALFCQLTRAHPGVEVWPDEGFAPVAGPTPGLFGRSAKASLETWRMPGYVMGNFHCERMMQRERKSGSG